MRGGGEVSRPGGQGSNVYVLCAERKEHKHFRSGTRPGESVTGVTEKLFMGQMCIMPGKEKTHKRKQICGIVPGLGGCQNFVYVLFRVKMLFMCYFFIFLCFFLPIMCLF